MWLVFFVFHVGLMSLVSHVGAWQGEHTYISCFGSVIACWYRRESLLTLLMWLRSTGALLMASLIRMYWNNVFSDSVLTFICALRFRMCLKTDHTTTLLSKHILVLKYVLCIPCLKRKGKLSLIRASHLFRSHVMFNAGVC